jgi:hypothetical protein
VGWLPGLFPYLCQRISQFVDPGFMKKSKKSTVSASEQQFPGHISLPGNFKISLTALVIAAMLIFTFILFSGALRNDFLIGWDDGEYLSDPSVSASGPINTSEIFSNFHLGMYQPLAVLSFAINYRISGAVASGFILTNILLHLLNTLLVFKLMERWMKGRIPAAIVALLFAIHPMHVEAVVWISTRSSALYSLFFLAGLLAWDKYLKNGFQTKHYLLALLFALLSLFSKSMAATFPIVLFVMDFMQRRKFRLRLITEKIPFLVFSIIFGIVAIKASASFGHITVLEQDYSLFQRFFLIVYGIAFYIIKFFLPTHLSAIYAFPELSNGQLPAYVFTSVIMIIGVLTGLWFSGKNKREFISGLLFFMVSIGMVLPLFWSRIFITADRYTYLPYIGLFMIPARLAADFWNSQQTFDQKTRRLFLIASGLVLASLSVATLNRVRVWKDVTTLLTDVIDKKRSDADMAHGYFYLANYYDAENKTDEAMTYYDLALSRNNKYLLALNNRGILKGKAGNISGAIADFEQAIHIKPNYAEAYYNRGVALYQKGEKQRACTDWQQATSLGFKPAAQAISNYCHENAPPDFKSITPD